MKELIKTAREEAIRITQEMKNEPQAAQENLEDLIEQLHKAEDAVRHQAQLDQIQIKPRPAVDFPNARSVMDTVIMNLKQEAEEFLGITGNQEDIWMTPEKVREAAPRIQEMVLEVVHFSRYDQAPGAALALDTLRNVNAKMALESLENLETASPDEMYELRLSNLREMAGDETAVEFMTREFPGRRTSQGGTPPFTHPETNRERRMREAGVL